MITIFLVIILFGSAACVTTPLVKDVEIIAFLDEGGKDTYTYSAGELLKITVTASIDYYERGDGMQIFLTGFSNETAVANADSFTEVQVWFSKLPHVIDFAFFVTVDCPSSGCGDPGLKYRIVLTEEVVPPPPPGTDPEPEVGSSGSGGSFSGFWFLGMWTSLAELVFLAICCGFGCCLICIFCIICAVVGFFHEIIIPNILRRREEREERRKQ
ncbi:MAG: hypothetical protein ACTSUE_11305 [Promethearchaeota archaeon]